MLKKQRLTAMEGKHHDALQKYSRKGAKVQCWGWEGKCDAVLDDDSEASMKAHGWGFMYAQDNFSPTGMGAYFACPDHKSKS